MNQLIREVTKGNDAKEECIRSMFKFLVNSIENEQKSPILLPYIGKFVLQSNRLFKKNQKIKELELKKNEHLNKGTGDNTRLG